ncbi:hypothetical protein SODALDRAFT_40012 [Sodiomyces alkalinus F11]|uniref:Uncharacterized protein n=1 Tax=Sodiomyces alkalinus (strain CBS 110278 / VKM F-3762 / F11) TaxID=1314773 RepID=A0A3N2Q9U2_SODAK|nr:hypothetical protein SODALDRAFT_40012 [Sodiomyces alkalinus F11]ROT43477.1 hypothetical protein SODALDRAFT_40012 [Sodiomyces alkalinus F11]
MLTEHRIRCNVQQWRPLFFEDTRRTDRTMTPTSIHEPVILCSCLIFLFLDLIMSTRPLYIGVLLAWSGRCILLHYLSIAPTHPFYSLFCFSILELPFPFSV